MWKLFRKLVWWHIHSWSMWIIETTDAPKINTYGSIIGSEKIVVQSRKCTTCGYYVVEPIQYSMKK